MVGSLLFVALVVCFVYYYLRKKASAEKEINDGEKGGGGGMERVGQMNFTANPMRHQVEAENSQL